MCWIFFALFMAIVSLGIMELIAAVFVESLLEEKANRDKVKLKQEARLKQELEPLITGVFQVFDAEGKEYLTQAQTEKAIEFMHNGAIRRLLEQIDVDDGMLAAAAAIADVTGGGENSRVTPTEFARALVSLTEAPRSSDLREVHQLVNQRTLYLETELQKTNIKLDAIIEHLGICARRSDTTGTPKQQQEHQFLSVEPVTAEMAAAARSAVPVPMPGITQHQTGNITVSTGEDAHVGGMDGFFGCGRS